LIEILEETTKNPITLMGKRSGICYSANIDDDQKNYKRGLDCLRSNHGRVLEYVNVEMIISGYSAKVIREWYTHLGGSPTRLQSSTRYINYDNFQYITPPSIKKDELADFKYQTAMTKIKDAYKELIDLGIPKEDASMLLPLGMTTKIVDKRNLRNLIDMSHQRMCNRAFWEYRYLFEDLCIALQKVSDEWAYIVDNYFAPKCDVLGYCTEKNSCGRSPKC